MRVAPVALFAHADLEQVSRLARLQARRTHAHHHAVDAAAIQALGVALALHTAVEGLDPPEFVAELAAWADTEGLADHLHTVASLLPSADLEAVTSQLGTSALALEAVFTALASFLSFPHSVRQTVEFAIRLGGDTDTIAAMAATLCGALVGEEAIPPAWTQRLPAAPTLRHLANELFEATAPPTAETRPPPGLGISQNLTAKTEAHHRPSGPERLTGHAPWRLVRRNRNVSESALPGGFSSACRHPRHGMLETWWEGAAFRSCSRMNHPPARSGPDGGSDRTLHLSAMVGGTNRSSDGMIAPGSLRRLQARPEATRSTR